MSSSLRSPVFGFAMLLLLGLDAPAQREKPHGITMQGKVVDSPERWSGTWEEDRADGSAIGLIFELTTTIHGAATMLREVPQYESSLQMAVFERHGPEIELGDADYFTDDGGHFLQWDGKRLHIGLNERANDVSTVTVNLNYNLKREEWTGSIRRRKVTGIVTLRRPHIPTGARANPIVGTWASADEMSHGCVHVVQRRDGGLTGWSDSLHTPGLTRYGNGLKPSETTYERYGQRVKVAQAGVDLYSLEFNAYAAICCSRVVFAKVHGETARFVGEGQDASSDAGVVWKRMASGSCRIGRRPLPSRSAQSCPQQ